MRSSGWIRWLVPLGVLVLALAIGACGDDDDDDGGGDGGGGKIAFLLPETQTTRYESDDRPNFEAAVADQCPDCEVLYYNADQDVATQQQQVETAITEEADVMVLDPVDSASAGGLATQAKEAGIPVISYDRLILNADIDLYISYDNKKVGEQQAQFLRNRAPKGNYILLGGAPTDHNAKLIREGQMAALEDAIKRGDIKIVANPWTPDWRADDAMALTETALKKAGGQVVAVVASNDITAGGAIKALEQRGLAGKVLVSGQDANLDAVRRIVSGTQTMTVYKPLAPLARVTAQAAVQMAKGEKVEGTSTIDNGLKQVQAVLLNPIAIHKGLVDQVIIGDRFHTREQVYGTAGQK
jgi:D-xylose transport system substrate-binding protein